MFANWNKFICDDINVKLVHFLMVDIKQHDMIQPALTCASKVGLQTPHGWKTSLTNCVRSWDDHDQAIKSTHFRKKTSAPVRGLGGMTHTPQGTPFLLSLAPCQ